MRKPVLNDPVHFVAEREQLRLCECKAATVARVRRHDELDLSVLMPTSIGYVRVPHDPDGRDGTWHWPDECRWT